MHMNTKITFIGSNSLHNYGIFLLTSAYAFETGRLLDTCDVNSNAKIQRLLSHGHSLVVFCPPCTGAVTTWLQALLTLCDMRIKHLVIYLDKNQSERERLISSLLSCKISLVYNDETIQNAQRIIRTRNMEGNIPCRKSCVQYKRLSVRERCVLTGYLSGIKVNEIALTLGLSPKTIYSYYHKCMKKIGVSKIRDLIML